MSTPDDVRKLLKAYAKRTGNPRVHYQHFAQFASKYAAKYSDEHPHLADLVHGNDGTLDQRVNELKDGGVVFVTGDDSAIRSVLVQDYFVDVVEEEFDKLKDRPELPFPDNSSLPTSIPTDAIVPVDVQSDFVNWITKTNTGPPRVLRLQFPEGVRPVLVPTTRLERGLPVQCVQKLRNYLRSEQNTAYIQQKLMPACRGREVTLKDFLKDILTRPDTVIETVFDPTEFSFLVWTQLCTVVIKDYAEKNEKLNEEHGFCQAAYLLGYYNVYYKGRVQRSKEAEAARNSVDKQMRRAPYAFTISQIQAFTDQRGVPLTKRVQPSFISEHIELKLRRDEDSLPELVRFRGADNGEYYICREYVVETILNRIYDLAAELREHYVSEFADMLKNDQEPPVLKDDTAFRKDVRDETARRDPIFAGLWKFDLVFLAAADSSPNRLPPEVSKLFHPKEKRLRDLEDVLGLDRKDLLGDARLLLPFWQVVPIVRGIVRFFRRLFLGKSDDKRTKITRDRARSGPAGNGESGTAGAAAGGGRSAAGTTTKLSGSSVGAATGGGGSGTVSAAKLQKAVKELLTEFVPEGKTLDGTLQELAERWNPLLDPTAKENLVEDVNSLARDFLRRMKAGFRVKPPTADRIRTMAAKLSENDAFKQIKRRDAFCRYLELYMLKRLGMER